MAGFKLKCSFVSLIYIVYSAGLVNAQEENVCYGPGSIATSVILSILFSILLAIIGYFAWKKYVRKRSDHLILETDPEKGKGEYAFDNPGFKDAILTPAPSKPAEKNKPDSSKGKWKEWSPLSGLTLKSDKKKTLDDSALENGEVKVVALRSHDFTGLGFNICGNMKEGIYIKDVLHRGPASESGKLNSGDRINSVTISFEHMVYEDALTILSYASPYEVIIEARGGKIIHCGTGQGGQPSHPVYRSSSSTDISQVEKAARKRLYDDGFPSLNCSLQKSKSNMTTLERTESKSPRPLTARTFTPDQLKSQLEQKIISEHEPNKLEAETQKTENKYQKFGVRVLPFDTQKSPKSSEQNENNLNIERNLTEIRSIDEVDLTKVAPQAKKREKKPDVSPDAKFIRHAELNSSGIKRDENGIPQEIPTHMMNAAVAAKRNRKGGDDTKTDPKDESPKKSKGKAPAPPEEKAGNDKTDNLDEIKSIGDYEESSAISDSPKPTEAVEIEIKMPSSQGREDYNSDSDLDNDNQSSVNTIELNSSDITIHQEVEEKQNRKTASTGDLSKIQKTRKTSSGTLERAQSLDITDTANSTLNRKRKNQDDDTMNFKSDEDLFGKVMLNKEPRLSLILDGLNTFQRNRLKKSTEWGNLEDAILKSSEDSSFEQNISSENISLTLEQSPELDAVVNKIKEIRRESVEINMEDLHLTSNTKEEDIKPLSDVVLPSFEVNIPSKEEVSVEKPKVNESWTVDIQDHTPKTNGNLYITNKQNKEPIKHKRQQIPVHTQEVALPPEETTLEKEIFDELNKHYLNGHQSPTKQNGQNEPPKILQEEPKSEIKLNGYSKVETAKKDLPKINDVVFQKTETTMNGEARTNKSNIPKMVDRTSSPPKEPPSANTGTKLRLKSNPETGEICMVTQNTKPIDYTQYVDPTKSFLLNERQSCSNDYLIVSTSTDTNISDDIKVSRHSLNSLERPKCDDVKSVETTNQLNISNVSIDSENGSSQLHSLELTVNDCSDDSKIDNSELYATALDTTTKYSKDLSKVTISTPDLIKNVTITEAINTLNNDIMIQGPSSINLEYTPEIQTPKFRTSKVQMSALPVAVDSNKKALENNTGNMSKHNSLTYITEIQVTPVNGKKNVSEVEVVSENTPAPKTDLKTNLDNEFENYVNKFGANVKHFETNIENFETTLNDFIPKEVNKENSVEIDAEKELHKIQEIAQEQLKKLPEMRFTTSYESAKTPEKRQSQIELLRSNFEKSPPKTTKTEISPKSRIPIATTTKTPPMSPERRDSRNLDTENDRAILELMSSSIHSTPMVSKLKAPNKNVTITSIRNNSKLPSGLPILGGSRPPIPPRKVQGNDDVIQVSTNGNTSFKQWVFDPVDSITNISIGNKEKI